MVVKKFPYLKLGPFGNPIFLPLFFLSCPKFLKNRYWVEYIVGVNFFNLMISSNLNSTSPSGLTISSFGMTAKCGFSWVKTFWNVWRSISYEHLRHLTTDNVPWSCNMSSLSSTLGYIWYYIQAGVFKYKKRFWQIKNRCLTIHRFQNYSYYKIVKFSLLSLNKNVYLNNVTWTSFVV